MVWMLISASVDGFSVSPMQDFCIGGVGTLGDQHNIKLHSPLGYLHSVHFSAVQCNAVQCSVVQSLQCSAVQCGEVQHSAVQ